MKWNRCCDMGIGMKSVTRDQGKEKAAPWRMAGLLRAVFPVVLLLVFVSEVVADGNVTLESITIYNTHEWFGRKPTVYFQCHEEEEVYLPDVLEKGVPYRFSGEESWQPLTTLYGTKCKRCGIYEEDTIKADDTFYEWELCPKAFSSLDGRYELFQEKEFNATFICSDCIPQRWSSRCERCRHSARIFEVLREPLHRIRSSPAPKSGTEGDSLNADEEEEKGGDKGIGMVLLIIFLVLIVLVGLVVVAYTKWRQKQRAEQQARVMKMFEDDTDLDAELGLILIDM
ncbi:hypothetical protein R1flu_020800 [Riccia fluitans]|uniref:DUF7953 domain-containing protein n=1 Tax=Riccia fluitans TaxID=41844 RepID=A0ABD1ZNQ7_9MARC